MGYYRQRASQNLLSVWRLATAFAEIAVHRRSPADLPASQFLVGLLVALYLVVELAYLRILRELGAIQTLLLLLDCAFFLAYVFVALRIFGRERRFRQTAAALLGAEVLLDLIGLPLAFWIRALDAPPDQATPPQLLYLLLWLWSVDVGGYIIGRAIARPYLVGLLFMILYVIASLGISDWMARAN